MLVVVRLLFVTGVVVVVGTMVTRMVMIMFGSFFRSAMAVGVAMLVLMLVIMGVPVLVSVHLISVTVLVLMGMGMFVFVFVLMLVVTFHDWPPFEVIRI